MNENILLALNIMWQGMTGVFAVILILSAIVFALARVEKKNK